MKKAFTLIEMLIVIGIIGVLAAVLLKVSGGASESARAAQCLSNMRALGQAWQAASHPFAQSEYRLGVKTDDTMQNVDLQYVDRPGWISWDSRGQTRSSEDKENKPISMYTTDREAYEYAITNGAIWKYIANRKTYVCPKHRNVTQNVHWSYLMNSGINWGYVDAGLPRATTTLLLGEIPFTHVDTKARQKCPGTWEPEASEGGGTETDAVLQYEDDKEHVGFNHKNGRDWYAHVVFVDGHAEKIRAPKENFTELTKFLCEGKPVGFNGTSYDKLN